MEHRLRRHRAGRRMDFDASSADVIADVIVDALDTAVDYEPVSSDGAMRAAAIIAELL